MSYSNLEGIILILILSLQIDSCSIDSKFDKLEKALIEKKILSADYAEQN
jgi:hypothetical protein